ncbi:hypothetical protein ACQEVG_23110 [Streptomyces sp. CA-135486]|uniref:hypothetical protein n=1 Tax=Streptomyces sp. CA-135486 TaxID=3240049 RepID=UPI003D8F7B25
MNVPPQADRAAGAVPPAQQQSPSPDPGPSTTEATEATEPEEQSQEARAAQRELFAHAPGFILGSAAAFGGSLVGGAQHGVSGGQVTGDVFMGGKTEIHHYGAAAGPAYASGKIPRVRLDQLAGVFVETPAFTAALQRLCDERVLVLSGAHATGRSAAALMLLHRLGVPAVRALQPETSPAALAAQLARPGGHVLHDMPLSRNKPLRDTHLHSARDQLKASDGYLVITVENSPYLLGVTPAPWEPPEAEAVLRAHVAALRAEDDIESLLALAPVRDFLAHGHHRPAEAADFAEGLAAYDGSEEALGRLAGFGLAAVQKQCRTWLSDPALGLRDKAFLISLAVFDQAPYALAAELADKLFVHFQRLQHPEQPPEIPVFGPAVTDRLGLARAGGELRHETTEWGPVPQYMAQFSEERTPRALLTEVWTGHPSARPALVDWLKQLARDGRPLVRTRAAAATALLAAADLPSTMALLLDGWALSRSFGPRVTAANTLTLAQLLDAPVILRLLSQWCTDPHWARRWTAIRAFALLAPLRPDLAGRALDALAARARADDSSEAERHNLVESTALLLSAGSRREMLSELVRLLCLDTPAVRALALAAFVRACDNAEEHGLVEWYTEYGMHDAESARDLATLWRTALGDRTHTRQAMEALRTWLYVAERRADTAQALELLLPALVSTSADRDRLSHLLETLRAVDGGPRPAIADRLLKVLHPARPPAPSH